MEIQYQHYPFRLPPLPYSYEALEPHLDAQTLHLHHDKHFKMYVDNLNRALEPYPEFQDWSLKALLAYADKFPEDTRENIRHNAGGVFNHDLYFSTMGPAGKQPGGSLAQAIERDFGSYERWKQLTRDAAITQFGSGWAWLVFDAQCRLRILQTDDQDVPPLTILTPILLIDVWEHAYYLKYQNRRDEYVDNWFRVIDWDAVAARYSCG